MNLSPVNNYLVVRTVEGTDTEKTCSECEADGLVCMEGCITCKGCGYAKCG